MGRLCMRHSFYKNFYFVAHNPSHHTLTFTVIHREFQNAVYENQACVLHPAKFSRGNPTRCNCQFRMSKDRNEYKNRQNFLANIERFSCKNDQIEKKIGCGCVGAHGHWFQRKTSMSVFVTLLFFHLTNIRWKNNGLIYLN